LPAVLASCDAGISFIRPSYSKRASSPTKVGEYLAAGLPVVTNTGVGDVDALFAPGLAGVLIPSFDARALENAARALLELVAQPETPGRCRELARRELDLDRVGGPRYVAVLRELVAATSD
jgi:glycosyltransferase involved in cell wall biosynthesis